ncbi:MAG: condensation domain-containing protein [Desulfobulbus sp.]|jgi:hypothetical protein|uniref:condensation domain-containing protein n=1 Tax=Desulfobulbus sp. TaxID=895 RepID=UPI00283DC16E|nr:condensation domain-containing protein [Desulfobulbus sp.]MDR2550513.1 condensation domain-containing protein [Desulfobulbus sp.]
MSRDIPLEKRYEFSKSQREQLDLEDDTQGESRVNSVCGLYWLDPRYSNQLIEKAANLILEHEQALRLRFAQRDGEFFQYEQEFEYVSIPAIETTWSRDEIIASARNEVMAKSFVPEAPLYDLLIVRNASAVALRSLFFHLVMDGISMGLWGDLLTSYCRMLFEGERFDCEAHSFTDSFEKEKHMLESPRRQADWRYWAEKMRDWTGCCKINPQKVATGNPRGKRLSMPLDKAFLQQIYAHCEERTFSPAILFRAALVLYLLCKNPGMRRIDLGETISHRKDSGQKQTMGNFALEILVCIVVPDQDADVESLYKAIRKAGRESYYHSMCSYEDVLRMVQSQRPEVEALRDVQFGYIPPVSWHRKAFDGTWIANESPETSLEFIILSPFSKEDVVIMFDYRDDTFSAEEAGTALHSILELVKACIANPSMSIRDACQLVEARG